MKILLVSWEYPPVVIGGLGRHVHHLAQAHRDAGHEVVVLSRQPPGTDPQSAPTTDAVVDGIRVIAAAEDPLALTFTEDMLPWVLSMGHSMVRAGLRLAGFPSGELIRRPWVPDVVHAHDWLAAHAAVGLAETFDAPLVSTFHATEAGRHSGWVATPVNKQVHSVEQWLAHESDAVITCSHSMHDEVTRLFGPGLAQVHRIGNGIDAADWPYRPHPPRTHADPQLLYVGRLEYEKGIQDAIAALPRIRRAHRGTTLTLAGTGTQLEWLREVAREHRVSRSVRFIGAQDHQQLLDLMHHADAMVIPSRYEPFGIVALEAAATGVPLAASSAGGLSDLVEHGVNGVVFEPGDARELATAVIGVLHDPVAARQRAEAARAGIGQHSWAAVGAATVEVYRAAKRRPREPLGRLAVEDRPLPERDLGNP